MDVNTLSNLLYKIKGCSFASIDSRCEPYPKVFIETEGERVILFTNQNCSGYENKVKRSLEEAGKNPDNFSVGSLPWGERVPNTPLIIHKDKYYLQTILLAEGTKRYFIGDEEVSVESVPRQALPRARPNQGLTAGSEVIVNTYKLESLTRIALMGEVLVASDEEVVIRLAPTPE